MQPRYLAPSFAPSSDVSTGALRALIQIHFEEFLALVDPALAGALLTGRAVCRDPLLEAPAGDQGEDAAALLFAVPARRGPARTLIIVVAQGSESRESVEDRLLDAYLDAFVQDRRPDRLIAVFSAGPEGPQGSEGLQRSGGEPPAVRLRSLVDRLDGEPGDPGDHLLRLPYLQVTLAGQPLDAYLTRRCFADNLAPFRTPFRKEPPCSSVSSVCPSRERRRFSIP